MDLNKDEYLGCVHRSYGINLEDDLINDNNSLADRYRKKRDAVQAALNKKFGTTLACIQHSGSYAKHTAINIKFDMDLCLNFKRKAFETLQSMYDAVLDYLESNEFSDDVGDLLQTRPQKVSVGLFFSVDGETLNFDITPGRRISDDDPNCFDLNLHLKTEESSTRMKTNIAKQVEHIKGRKKERETIRLLKAWKFAHFPNLKSFLLELLTIKAFDTKGEDNVPAARWERLKLTMEFIRDNIETINLADPGNSSNNVAASLSDEHKTELARDMKRALTQIDSDASKLKFYFPENPKFPCEEKKAEDSSASNRYSQKPNVRETIYPPATYA
ncbi:hypothetical protein GCM10023172_01740 [Hymenobacter ginsengisoli]|uniref:Nucleotidyltransferase n=1 Tax=Hymenobacter ginsengisoli TaxID=1051626 RepID=A0ABP8PYH8_9BACT|nr:MULTISPECIES: hypothetical protein [unclassified Hymenobacter]MBO2033568.1 hypothetical protein [Hymenobacter sp. BT559]